MESTVNGRPIAIASYQIDYKNTVTISFDTERPSDLDPNEIPTSTKLNDMLLLDLVQDPYENASELASIIYACGANTTVRIQRQVSSNQAWVLSIVVHSYDDISIEMKMVNGDRFITFYDRFSLNLEEALSAVPSYARIGSSPRCDHTFQYGGSRYSITVPIRKTNIGHEDHYWDKLADLLTKSENVQWAISDFGNYGSGEMVVIRNIPDTDMSTTTHIPFNRAALMLKYRDTGPSEPKSILDMYIPVDGK